MDVICCLIGLLQGAWSAQTLIMGPASNVKWMNGHCNGCDLLAIIGNKDSGKAQENSILWPYFSMAEGMVEVERCHFAVLLQSEAGRFGL